MRFVPRLPKDLPEFVTTDHLAKLLGVCYQTVRNWSRRGFLPHPVVISPKAQVWNVRAVRMALARAFPELRERGDAEASDQAAD